MSDLKTQLIETAVRPLDGDAEIQLAAVQLLGELVKPGAVGAEEAIARWEVVDAGKRRPFRRWALTSLLAAISVIFLAQGTHYLIGLYKTQRLLLSLGSLSSPPVLMHELGGKNLTQHERLILFGDETQPTKSGKAKGIWDSQPESAPYFSQYTEACLSENHTLPGDFLTTARRIDPNNAWFTYVAAGSKAKDSVKSKRKPTKSAPKEWDLLDPEKMVRSLTLIHEARSQATCTDYGVDLLLEKIPLLPQETRNEKVASWTYLFSLSASTIISARQLGDVIAAKASILAKENKVAEFRELAADADWLQRKTLSMENTGVVAGLVFQVNTMTISQAFATAAKEMDLHPEAEKFQEIYASLEKNRKARDHRDMMIDGVELNQKSDFLTGVSLPMLRRLVEHAPEITDTDLLPGRLSEHEEISILCAVAAFLFFGIGTVLAWAYRFRHPRLVRRLSARVSTLMQGEDWAWILTLGVLLPFSYVMAISRFTPLGGRNFSVFGLLGILPAAHFVALILLVMISPILVTRWRLGKRAKVIGPAPGKPWIGGLCLLLAYASIPVTGFICLYNFTHPMLGITTSFFSGSSFTRLENFNLPLLVAGSLLVVLPALWLLATAVIAVFQTRQRLLRSCTMAQLLVPAYAFAMFTVISMVPPLISQEKHWSGRDTFLKLDPAFPGMTPYEYKVSAQLQKETLEQLGNP